MKWQEDVLNSNLKYTIARAPRTSGKTFVAMQWARQQYGKRVLFYSANRQQSTLIARAMVGVYEDEITNYRIEGAEKRIFFRDGTSIFFHSGGATRGLMIESLVVDDVPHFDRRRYAEAGAINIKNALFVGSEVCEFGKGLLDSVRGKVNYVVCDYLDLLKTGFFKLDDIREAQKVMSLESFMNEFGPWEKPKELVNEDYLYLLQS